MQLWKVWLVCFGAASLNEDQKSTLMFSFICLSKTEKSLSYITAGIQQDGNFLCLILQRSQMYLKQWFFILKSSRNVKIQLRYSKRRKAERKSSNCYLVSEALCEVGKTSSRQFHKLCLYTVLERRTHWGCFPLNIAQTDWVSRKEVAQLLDPKSDLSITITNFRHIPVPPVLNIYNIMYIYSITLKILFYVYMCKHLPSFFICICSLK
jgi:hypothetical protein